MSTIPQPSTETVEIPPAGSELPRWLLALLGILVLVMAYMAYAQYSTGKELIAQLKQANRKLVGLETRAATLEDNYANLKAQFDVTGERLGLTQDELNRARILARQIKEEQRRTAEQLAGQIELQQNQLGSLTGEVSDVKGDVAATQEALEKTQMRLERTIGDLGLKSGLIARNRDELEELKSRGERDYFEFDLRKSKKYARVGSISVRLNKTDRKRQKYTMTLLANDKRIEKKDKTLLEPVQFYLKGTRHLLEIVVYEVENNRVAGYLSVPKEVAMRQ